MKAQLFDSFSSALKSIVVFVFSVLVASHSATARDLQSVTVPGYGLATVDKPVTFKIDLSPGNKCGAEIEFGDGVGVDVMLEANVGAYITHQFSASNNYVVMAQGKTIWRGLGTYPACDGKVALALQVSADHSKEVKDGFDHKSAARPVANQTHVLPAAKVTDPPNGKRIALVVGNDNYIHVEKLTKARNDAASMASELKAAGFEVMSYSDLNYRAMVKAIERLASKISSGDQVVVFFAGHGVQIRTGNYLLPIDIEAGSEAEIEKTAYGLDDLTEKVDHARASFSLVLVDACRDNPLRDKGRSIGASRGLAPPDPPRGQIIVYSASRGQKALEQLDEHDTSPNGLFTREFLLRMRRPGVKIEDLVREVQDSVEALAKSVRREQTPAIYSQARGSFYFYGAEYTEGATRGHAASDKRLPDLNVSATPLPTNAAAFTFEDLEREEATRKQWMNWQKQMNADFDRASQFSGAPDLKVRAWERFLASWGQNNPLDKEDDILREKALGELQSARGRAEQLEKRQAQSQTHAASQRLSPSVYFPAESRTVGDSCNTNSDCKGALYCERAICTSYETLDTERIKADQMGTPKAKYEPSFLEKMFKNVTINIGDQGNPAAPQASQNKSAPTGLFPYGSNVSCPQVPVENGMARCQ